jgi:hypothetical protein
MSARGGCCADIGEQVAKAEKAVAGKAPVKRNRFSQRSGGPAPHPADPHTITAARMAGDAVPSQALRNLHGGRPINTIPH